MKVIDLSKSIQYNTNDPFFMRVKVRHKPHYRARWLMRLLGLPFKLMPKDFVGWADDTITKMGTHSTTHIDAPWHYGPTTHNGEQSLPAVTVDEIPLEKCIAPGIVIDMCHKREGEAISVEDIKAALGSSGAKIEPGVIVLIHTGRDKYMGSRNYWKQGTGMSAAATEWIIDQGCTVMGIDQWGWDLPFHYQIKQSKQQARNDLFWEGHRVGQKKPYWQMEQLVNLGELPAHGFEVAVLPLKLIGASAAPARVVAILRS